MKHNKCSKCGKIIHHSGWTVQGTSKQKPRYYHKTCFDSIKHRRKLTNY